MPDANNEFEDVNRHFWLTRSMARTLGINLSEAVASGRLSTSEYADMVTQCGASACADKCAVWLAGQCSTPDAAPEFCAHVERLERLRPG